MITLSERQESILMSMMALVEELGRIPSIRQIAEDEGLSLSAVRYNLDAIERKGYVTRIKGHYKVLKWVDGTSLELRYIYEYE